ncbi:MAG: peptidase M64 [Bacteroidales bacterium]|nr:peptidase M64 [Bacteroidales bacterium]
MRKLLFIFLLVPLTFTVKADPVFNQYFTGQTMRVDFYMTGDSEALTISLDQVYREGRWPGNPDRLIDRLNNGNYYVKIYSLIDNKLIFSKGFNCIFGEYQTTRPAKEGEKRTFIETVRFPYPESPFTLVIEKRNRKNILQPVFSRTIDPDNENIIREEPAKRDRAYNVLKNGDPRKKVDLVFVAEGYTSGEWSKFKSDADHFTEVLFRAEPFKSHKELFNVYGAFRPSSQSGVDHPTRGTFRNTAIDASFNALNLPRYLLVDDRKAMRDIASVVPYDAIIVIANTDRYGGGGIYNNYTLFTADDSRSEATFMHEFGHGFGGLADEYFSSTVSYEDYYPEGVEPTEPNITALLDTNQIKWEAHLSPGIPVPTPWGQDEVIKIKKKQRANEEKMKEEIEKLKSEDVSNQTIQQIREKYSAQNKQLDQKIEQIRDKYRRKYEGKIGVFEGAGYQAKGLYRSEIGVHMFDSEDFTYGPVSEEAIMKVIRRYTE